MKIIKQGRNFLLLIVSFLIVFVPLNSSANAPIRINAGDGEFMDCAGNTWNADYGFNTGGVGYPNQNVQDARGHFVLNQSLFNRNRFNVQNAPELMYSFDLPNGDYKVRLYFVETYDAPYGVGKRVFDVDIEGQLVWTNLDVFAEVGAERILIKESDVTVTDGQINIEFLHGQEGHPMVSAIEILEDTGPVTYYIKQDGDDSADGLTDTTAWQTIEEVSDCRVFSPGDDIYFKAGNTFENAELYIGWSGTSDNRVIVGSYYLEGATPKLCSSSTCTNKAIFRGGYRSSTNLGNIPTSIHNGLIVIDGKYITIQNLKVKDSSGHGVQISGGSNTYNIVENTEIDHTVGASLFVFDGSDYATVRNNIISRCSWSDVDGFSVYGNHPACLGLRGSDYGLIEDNSLYDLHGEGIDLFDDANFNIVRGNLVAHAKNPHIYIDNAANNIIENNIILGKGVDNSFGAGAGISVSIEDRPPMYSSVNNIIRNNIIVGVNKCFYAEIPSPAIVAGKTSSGMFIGNTCVVSQYGINFLGSQSRYSDWEIANNIFWEIASDLDGCEIPSDPDLNLHHNYWPSISNSTQCNGIGDVVGPLNFEALLDEIKLFSFLNLPAGNAFQPQSGSIVEDAGENFNYVNALDL